MCVERQVDTVGRTSLLGLWRPGMNRTGSYSHFRIREVMSTSGTNVEQNHPRFFTLGLILEENGAGWE
jgi:hypothetical protein